MRRGEVRTALLIALLDGPGHGYELIQLLETKTEGRWRPSPGSVYPSLQMLADEGLAPAADVDGKRVYAITDEGRTVAEDHIATKGYPWVAMDEGRGDQRGLMSAMKDMAVAAKMVGMSGSPEDIERAAAVLNKARKDLYGILADD